MSKREKMEFLTTNNRESVFVRHRSSIGLHILAVCLLVITVFFLRYDALNASALENDVSALVAKQGCSYYFEKKAVAEKRSGYLNFGDEIEVVEKDETWTQFRIDDAYYYVLSRNLQEKVVMMNYTGIQAWETPDSKGTSMGYVMYGTELTVLDTVTVGAKNYVHCTIPQTYTDSLGNTVKGTNVTGYVLKEKVAEAYVLKVTNSSTYLYEKASSSAERTPIKMGEQVKALCANETWSKVEYQGKIGYLYNTRIDSMKMDVSAQTVKLRRTISTSSAIQATLYWGTDIEVIREYTSSSGTKYYYCKYNGKEGFIQAESAGVLNLSYIEQMVTTEPVSLYEKAVYSSKEIASLEAYQQVTVLYKGEKWIYAVCDGKKGYLPLAKLGYLTKVATGSYSKTAAKCFKDVAAGTLQNETVFVILQDKKLDIALIETKQGERLWVRKSTLKDEGMIKVIGVNRCGYYCKKNGTEENKIGSLYFADEVLVLDILDNWATIKIGEEVAYVLTRNIIDRSLEVNTEAARVLSKDGSLLGYATFGVNVQTYDTFDISGDKYYRCLIPTIYTTASADTVAGTEVVGYIMMSELKETSVSKIIKIGTNLYESPRTDAESIAVTTGEEVYASYVNETWSKIIYDDKAYFIYSSKLDDKMLNVTEDFVVQTSAIGSDFNLYNNIYWNEPVCIIDEYETAMGDIYAYCNYNGLYGYVKLASGSGETYLGTNTKAYVNSNIDLYKKAVAEVAIASVKADSDATILYQGKNWSKIVVNGVIGFISNTRLSRYENYVNGNIYDSAYCLKADKMSDVVEAEKVKLIASDDALGFAYVENQTGQKYWVKSESLSDAGEKTVMYVKSIKITLHETPDAESECIEIPYMTEVLYRGVASSAGTGCWLRVLYDDSIYYCWQPSDETYLTTEKSSFAYTCETMYQQEVIDMAVDIALNWPTKYVHDQSTGIIDSDGRYGFDCSGFTSYVLNAVMQKYVPVYRITRDEVGQWLATSIYNAGYRGEFNAIEIELKDAQPGDVLCFDLDDETSEMGLENEVDHVGFYLGNNEFVHSSQSWDGDVCIYPLTGSYLDKLVCIKRFLPANVEIADVMMYTYNNLTKVYCALSSESETITTLGSETQVKVLFTSENWAYVQYGEEGNTGYIFRENLKDSINEISEVRYITSTTKKLYLEPSTSSDNITAFLGEEVNYKGQLGTTNYYKVVYKGNDYYAWSDTGVDSILALNLDKVIYEQGTATLISSANLRATPKTVDNENVIERLRKSDVVHIYHKGPNWTYLYNPLTGSYGFVLNKYLNINN